MSEEFWQALEAVGIKECQCADDHLLTWLFVSILEIELSKFESFLSVIIIFKYFAAQEH